MLLLINKYLFGHGHKLLFLVWMSVLMNFSTSANAAEPATNYNFQLVNAPEVVPDPMVNQLEFYGINDAGIITYAHAWVLNDSDNDPSDGTLDIHAVFEWGAYNPKTGEFKVSGTKEGWNIDGGGPLLSESGYQSSQISNSGVTVTGSDLVSGKCSWVDKEGNIHDLLPLLGEGALFCTAGGVAPNGVISGSVQYSDRAESFVYDPKYKALELFLPGRRSNAQSVNAKGQTAGIYQPTNAGSRRAYIRDRDGSVRLFKVLINNVEQVTRAFDIAEDGTIVGTFITGGYSYGFVAKLPETDPNDDDPNTPPVDELVVPSFYINSGDHPECGGGLHFNRINSKGVIAGTCITSASDALVTEHGVILTPVTMEQ